MKRKILLYFSICIAVVLVFGPLGGVVNAKNGPPFVWTQVNEGGFGDPVNEGVLVLENFKGDLYAGVFNYTGASIWRWDGDVDWIRVTEYGFGNDPPYTGVIDLVTFDGQLYAALNDWMGFGLHGQVWRTADGVYWEPVVQDGFGNTDNYGVLAMTVYNDVLYASTGNDFGTEIWRSFTGDPGSWELVVEDGFGTGTNNQVTGFANFKGYLYAAIETNYWDMGNAQVWRSASGDWGTWELVTDGFGDPTNKSTGGFAIYQGFLYLGTLNFDMDTFTVGGGQLWRTRNGMEWEPVTTDGFGDNGNFKFESLYTFRDRIYAATWSIDPENFTDTGTRVFSSVDGLDWMQVNDDGFGNSCNYATLWSNATIQYKGSLIYGTWNYDGVNDDFCTGGEIWQFSP